MDGLRWRMVNAVLCQLIDDSIITFCFVLKCLYLNRKITAWQSGKFHNKEHVFYDYRSHAGRRLKLSVLRNHYSKSLIFRCFYACFNQLTRKPCHVAETCRYLFIDICRIVRYMVLLYPIYVTARGSGPLYSYYLKR